MLPTKIVLIGAGSAIFGLNTLGALMQSERLRGSRLALVDLDSDALERMTRLAGRLNSEWGGQMVISAHTQHEDALEGAEFVVSAIEVPPRERLWRQDFEVTLRHGVRQPYAENGGPGGFAHAARNVLPVLKIAHDMEQACPNAWFVNFSNPMVRICDAIRRYSKIKVVGLCHQIYEGYGMAGFLLADRLGIKLPPRPISAHAVQPDSNHMHTIIRQAVQKIDIKAAGLNHFTWMLDVREKSTGEDLYPLLTEAWKQAPDWFEPLTRRSFEAFGIMPIPGDGHLCEYLPWMSDPNTKPWEKYNILLYHWDEAERGREEGHTAIARMGAGEAEIEHLREVDSEGAVEVIENIAGAGNHYHLAVNLPNEGQIANLPAGAIVETPGIFSGMGANGVAVGDLPEPVAELCRREIMVGQLTVDAAVTGDRQKALQALLLDPVIRDMDVAKEILDDYLLTFREHLPQFWK